MASRPVAAVQRALVALQRIDFLGPLALRLYLVPIFWMAGTQKLANMEGTIAWFGNPEWGLGLPFPALMAWLAALSESVGAVLLLVGLGVRLASFPLMVTMVVAAVTVHWNNGWLAIAEGSSEAGQRLGGLLEWLAVEHPGRYEYVTELGRPVVLNNGIEFAATYFVMLLVLLLYGGGRHVSADYWLGRALLHDRTHAHGNSGERHACQKT